MFFVSKAALPLVTNTSIAIVAGRTRIDNYLLGACRNDHTNCTLFDGTFSIAAIHNGDETYRHRAHSVSKEDMAWNDRLIRRYALPKSTLCHNDTELVLKDRSGMRLMRRNEWIGTESFASAIQHFNRVTCITR